MRVCQFRHFGTVECLAPCGQTPAVVSYQSFKRMPCCQLHAACLTLRALEDRARPGDNAATMTEPIQTQQPASSAEIPEELALEIRKLAHDLSNALEIIVQTSFLLGTVELKEPGSDWLRMLDGGVR